MFTGRRLCNVFPCDYQIQKMQTLIFLFAVLIADCGGLQGRNIKCIENFKCVPLSQCRTEKDDNILYPCNDNQTHVCCAPERFINESSVVGSRTSIFPDPCGSVPGADRITGGDIASIGQFPWMALLGYTQQGLDFVQFLCGGSVITQEHVLTAAHCIFIDPRLKLSVVRFGELNLETEQDCEISGPKDKYCSDPYIDISVESTRPHENFNNQTLENDIALVKLKKKITFTDFVQPICLPFQTYLKNKITANEKLIVSGWGKTDSVNVGGSSTLQFAPVTVWDQGRCNKSVPPKVRPIRESQLCANGVKREDACKGDSGGPLVNSTPINGDIRNYQLGIVSFSSAQVCGNAELPTVYTKVDYFLNWIVTNVV